jgi:hypothetical protein
MPASHPPHPPHPPHPSRPLPPRPSLEYERKEAKALHRRLRAGDADALARAAAQHPRIRDIDLERRRLSDAQLVIAREYGFTSWPRLARYFDDVARQQHVHRTIPSRGRDFYEASVRSLLAEHRARRGSAARFLAAYVPAFYGLPEETIHAATVTDEEARLAVARSRGFPSWDVLLFEAEHSAAPRASAWEVDPMVRAGHAMKNVDLNALQQVVADHPELLRPTPYEFAKGKSLLAMALHWEAERGEAALRPIVDWLVERGLDLQRELDTRLCGRMYMEPERVRRLLARGANPNWIAPNGISVLEHAILRYWNGTAVDVLAAHARRPDALWICAGLGDVNGVARFLDRRGRPTRAARRHRPDFDAVAETVMAPHPDPSDEEILLEAFLVAMLNGRTAVLDYMAARGTPVDSLLWSSPVINVAVGNAWAPVVESLVRSGADLDLRGYHPDATARELAAQMFVDNARDPARRRIAEVCGLDPDALLAEADARRGAPAVEARLRDALERAADDAARQGNDDIGEENLLFGLLRRDSLALLYFTKVSGMDLDAFRAGVGARVFPPDALPGAVPSALSAAAQARMDRATALANERRRDTVGELHLLLALLEDPGAFTARLLGRYGGDRSVLVEQIERSA